MIEYLQNNPWQLWASLALLCLIIELTSGDFFIICFAFGSVASMILSLFGAGWVAQVVTMAVVAVICLIFVRPTALRYIHRHDNDRPSNADALLGREGRVTEAIPPGGYGRVAIDGDDWKAETKAQYTIEVGQRVKVVGRESIIITVEQL